jgi:hypothetical protein
MELPFSKPFPFDYIYPNKLKIPKTSPEIFNFFERVSRKSHSLRSLKPLDFNISATGKTLFPDPLWFDSAYKIRNKFKILFMGGF